MKNLKSILLGLTLLVVAVAAKATGITTADKLTKNDVLNIYMNAAAHGKIEGLDKVLADDVQYNITRGANTTSIDKKQMMEFFKSNANVDQDCKCATSTIEDTDERLVVKFDMKFDGYTNTHVVTIVNKGYGWEISKVDTSVAKNA